MENEAPTFDVRKLVEKAQISCESVFANQAFFSITSNEAYLDFYLIEPSKPISDTPNVQLVARVILPVGVVKGVATGLANAIAMQEKIIGKIPNQREAQPGDTIKIWD